MIDIETELFNTVATIVRNAHTGVYVTGSYNPSPSSFPCVSIVEIFNAVYRNTSTNVNEENHAAVTYEVNVYSNKQNGRKAECKAILNTVDVALANLGFTRRMAEPIPNMEDATVYRMLARYRAVVGSDSTIYRR